MLKLSTAFRSLLPLTIGFVLLLASAGGSLLLSARQDHAYGDVRAAFEMENRLNHIQTLADDAETGQRGFLLTGRIKYLDPFQLARQQIGPEIDEVARQIAVTPRQRDNLVQLRELVAQKLAELQQTIDLSAAGQNNEALAIVNNDSGKELMDNIRAVIADMQAESRGVLEQRTARASSASRGIQVILVVSAVVVVVLGAFALRDGRERIAGLESANDQLRQEISIRREAQGQVRQLQKMEAVGQLTGGIAHDFNNMLAVVIGSLNLAKRRLTGQEHAMVGKCIDSATEGAQRAATLTSRLLAFSRQQPLEPKVVDANKLVAGMSEMLARTLGETIHVETVLAAGLWRSFADPAQIESALINLAVNARDAMPSGGKLTIETGNADLDERYARANSEVAPGQYVVISVTDNGVGMGPEVVDRAFDPFYTTKGTGKGTGLGLSQVFGFVKQSAGHVKIYSEVGRGTTVKVYLPRYHGADKPLAAGGPAGGLPMGNASEIILVVEDDASVRHITVDSLTELGYTVVEAAGPNNALEQLALQPNITLLLTDIVMPEMTGRELADRALVRWPSLKVLYTTGYTRNAIVHNGVLDPGTALIPKPFTIEQLAAKVREVLDALGKA